MAGTVETPLPGRERKRDRPCGRCSHGSHHYRGSGSTEARRRVREGFRTLWAAPGRVSARPPRARSGTLRRYRPQPNPSVHQEPHRTPQPSSTPGPPRIAGDPKPRDHACKQVEEPFENTLHFRLHADPMQDLVEPVYGEESSLGLEPLSKVLVGRGMCRAGRGVSASYWRPGGLGLGGFSGIPHESPYGGDEVSCRNLSRCVIRRHLARGRFSI